MSRMLKDRSGMFPRLMFIGIFALPLLGLMLMDFELRKANDLTGEFLAIDSVSSAASTGSVYGVYAVVALCALLIGVYVMEGRKKVQKMTDDSLSDINKKIDDIDRKVKDIK